jgi:hypothetical protein
VLDTFAALCQRQPTALQNLSTVFRVTLMTGSRSIYRRSRQTDHGRIWRPSYWRNCRVRRKSNSLWASLESMLLLGHREGSGPKVLFAIAKAARPIPTSTTRHRSTQRREPSQSSSRESTMTLVGNTIGDFATTALVFPPHSYHLSCRHLLFNPTYLDRMKNTLAKGLTIFNAR